MDEINYTIIIPHHNIPQLLQRCLDSIPIREDVQVIVVDDNSDPSVVDFSNFPKWEGSHYETYFTKEGKGAGYARNVGLEYAIGKWVLFADADDFFTKEANQILNHNVSTDANVMFFRPRSVMCENLEMISHRTDFINEFIDNYLSCHDENGVRVHFVAPWSKIYNRLFIVENNFVFDETKYSNDVWFSVCTGCTAKKIYVSDETLYVVTERENSLANDFCKKPGELELRAEILFRACECIVAHGYKIDETRVLNMLCRFFKKDMQTFLKYFSLLCHIGYGKYELIWKLVKHNNLSSKMKRIPYLLYITRKI